MQTSELIHLEKDMLVIVRKSFIDITGSIEAGILLSYFEYWHNIKVEQNKKNAELNKIAEQHGEKGMQDTTLLQFHTMEEIQQQTLGLLSIKKIRKARKILKDLGFIEEYKNPNPRYKFDNTIFYKLNVKKVNNALLKLRKVKSSSSGQNGTTVVSKWHDGSVQMAATIPKTSYKISHFDFDINKIHF